MGKGWIVVGKLPARQAGQLDAARWEVVGYIGRLMGFGARLNVFWIRNVPKRMLWVLEVFHAIAGVFRDFLLLQIQEEFVVQYTLFIDY